MSFGVGIGDILKLCEVASRVYKNCRDCTGEYKKLTTDARNLANLLEDISDKYENIPEGKRRQFSDAYEACAELLLELDKTVVHYNGLDTRSKRAWDRLKWDPERSRVLRERLTSSVAILNGFYSSLIHDNQVLILEALGRLEKDYRGGHREGSIASVHTLASVAMEDGDEEDEEEAWSQIIRDLEDVGVTLQHATEYRDFIIDWFVRAVSEGRFQEEHADPQVFDTTPRDLSNALPATHPPDIQTPHFPLRDPRGRFDSSPNQTSMLGSPIGYQMTPPVALQHESPPSRFQSTRTGLDTQASNTPIVSPVHQAAMEYGIIQDDRQHTSIPDFPDAMRAPTTPSPVTSTTKPSIQKRSCPSSEAVCASTTHPTLASPPAYEGSDTLEKSTLKWRAEAIIAAWINREFFDAGKLLQEQLDAVERGETTSIGGEAVQPDRRLLRHFLGICASYTGDFPKAKMLFESVSNLYLDSRSLDEGDVAAARWLGDVCLHLREPHNTALAWAVAFSGLIGQYGGARDTTRLVYQELYLLDYWLRSLQHIKKSLEQNIDLCDIFTSSHVIEKSSLISSVAERLPQDGVRVDPVRQDSRPPRPNTGEIVWSCLLQPTHNANWPLPWDVTFVPGDAIDLHRYTTMPLRAYKPQPLIRCALPTAGLMSAKELHYITKRSQRWLAETVKSGLRDLGIEHREQGPMIACRVDQQYGGYAYSTCIHIKFRKLQFRSMYGLKITGVQAATRAFPPVIQLSDHDASGFVHIVRSIVDTAEKEEREKIDLRQSSQINPYAAAALEVKGTRSIGTASAHSAVSSEKPLC